MQKLPIECIFFENKHTGKLEIAFWNVVLDFELTPWNGYKVLISDNEGFTPGGLNYEFMQTASSMVRDLMHMPSGVVEFNN